MAIITKYIGLSSGEVMPISLSYNNTYLDSNYDIDYIIRLLKSEVIVPRIRILVLYPDESYNYEIPLEDIKPGGSYNENYQDGQRRSISFSLYNEDGKYIPTINNLWAGTRLELDLGIELTDGSTVWVKKGIYIIKSSSVDESTGGKTVNITAADKFSMFETKTGTLEESYEIPVGSEIQHVVEDILSLSQGNGYPYDSKPIIFHPSLVGKKTQATISKSSGDTLGSILLELAVQLSAEVFYNASGNLTFIPSIETTADVDKPLIYEFNTEQGDIGNLNFTFDMDNIINRIIVIGSAKNGDVAKAVAVNDDESSPLCFQRIGYRTGQIINDSNITTTYLAEERAQYELRKQLINKSSTSVNIVFNPLLEVNNLISIVDEFFGFNAEKFLIQSLSCNLDYSGSMSMTISNTANFEFLSGGRVQAGLYTGE